MDLIRIIRRRTLLFYNLLKLKQLKKETLNHLFTIRYEIRFILNSYVIDRWIDCNIIFILTKSNFIIKGYE